mmetsp:Transcript_30625/g.71949  ORF Transcript_30625/g.71949 Transcript_30625/m.71949 type:complete len:81 (-) Transcript_30625:6-248(-)
MQHRVWFYAHSLPLTRFVEEERGGVVNTVAGTDLDKYTSPLAPKHVTRQPPIETKSRMKVVSESVILNLNNTLYTPLLTS